MPIISGDREVDTIDCRFGGDSLVVVSLGFQVTISESEIIPDEDALTLPKNCPRSSEFNESKKIGCLTCSEWAEVTYC